MYDLVYLEYRLEDGGVEKIHPKEFFIREGYGIAKTIGFNLGDEENYCIFVGGVDEDNNLIHSSYVLQTPMGRYLQSENLILTNYVAELWYDNMLKDVRIQEQDTEIANLWYEIMTVGVI